MALRGHKIPIALSLVVWCLVWEVVGRLGLISLIPPFTEVLGAIPEVIGSPSFAEAAKITFQAYGIGMALSLTIGIGMGILMGRVLAIGELMGMWVNIFEELSADGRGTRAHRVARFRPLHDDRHRVRVLGVGDRSGHAGGRRTVVPSLVEMGQSFGASKRDLYLKILFFASLPELLAGIRLGLIRGLKGVIIGQLLIAVVGIGYLFELYSPKLPDAPVLGAADLVVRICLSPRRR